MRATIIVELDEERARAYLAEVYAHGATSVSDADARAGDEDPPPEPLEWFRGRLVELIEDEFQVATMYGPGMRFELGEVER